MPRKEFNNDWTKFVLSSLADEIAALLTRSFQRKIHCMNYNFPLGMDHLQSNYHDNSNDEFFRRGKCYSLWKETLPWLATELIECIEGKLGGNGAKLKRALKWHA